MIILDMINVWRQKCPTRFWSKHWSADCSKCVTFTNSLKISINGAILHHWLTLRLHPPRNQRSLFNALQCLQKGFRLFMFVCMFVCCMFLCLFGFYVFSLKNVLFVVVLLGATKLRLQLFGQCPNRGDMNFKGASLRFFVCLCPFVCMFVCLLACLFLFLLVCLYFMFFCL